MLEHELLVGDVQEEEFSSVGSSSETEELDAADQDHLVLVHHQMGDDRVPPLAIMQGETRSPAWGIDCLVYGDDSTPVALPGAPLRPTRKTGFTFF